MSLGERQAVLFWLRRRRPSRVAGATRKAWRGRTCGAVSGLCVVVMRGAALCGCRVVLRAVARHWRSITQASLWRGGVSSLSQQCVRPLAAGDAKAGADAGRRGSTLWRPVAALP